MLQERKFIYGGKNNGVRDKIRMNFFVYLDEEPTQG